MGLREYERLTVTDFSGQWTKPEPADVPVTRSLLSQNTEFSPGSIAERRGFGSVWNPNEPIGSMFNWVSSAGDYLLYYNPTSGKVRLVTDLTSPSPADMYTQAGAVGAVMCSGGTRVYSTLFDSNGLGVGQCRVIGKYAAAFNVDKAFLGPLTTKPVLTNTGTGSVTSGLKRVGYIIQTRNGFLGRISPIDATTNQFDTTSTITATGGRTIGFTVNPATWPVEADRIWFVMTTTANLDRYFIVPNAVEIHVPGGTNFPVSVTLDISDADLASTGTEVTANNLLFTQDAVGAGPFNPFSVGTFGSRTVYLTELAGISQGYASDPDDQQAITADQSVFYLPGFKQMKSQGAVGQILYVLGPNWTYAFEDTGDVPVTWPSPRLVDGSIGTLATRGFTVNASTGFGWCAHTSGLYPFQGGSFAPLPISYMNESDWKRINWNAAATVQVVDDKNKQRVSVLAPLDGASLPTHLLVFDYTDGLSSDRVNYSLWNVLSYNPGAACIVQNPSTSILELWLGDSVAGKVLRQKSATEALPYNDDGNAIDFQFETAYMPGLQKELGTVWYHYGRQLRATGNGTLHTTVYSMDRTTSQAVANVTLTAAPGQLYANRYPRVRSESVSYRFTMNAANEYAVISANDHFFAPGPSRR